VYNQSTTQAQVLVDLAVNVMPENAALVTNVATFSSMTKDSGQAATAGVNADWTTNDASAGRLVSGTLASTLASGDVVKVYANGVLINGNATVNSAGTAWEITDTTGYTGSWAYTAQVVNSAGQGGAVTVQQVNLDVTAVTPVITSVTDSSGVRINNEGSTANRLGTVTGTGVAGETIHLYDNTGTNLVGSTVVTNDGTWSISGLSTNAAVGYGSNTFSARQVDAVGNTSAQSNLWTVLSTNGNTFTNGYFDGGSTNGFANSLTLGAPSGANDSYQVTQTGTGQTTSGTTDVVSGPTAYTFGTWSTKYLVGLTNPDGAMKDYTLNGQVSSTAVKTIWQQIAPVVTGKTYLFTFDYIQRDFVNQDMAVWIDGVKIQFVENAANQNQSGHFTATYVSAKTGNITISLEAANDGTGNLGDYTLDNFAFGPIAAPLPDGTLVAGGTPPGTAGVDGVVGVNNGSVLTYKGGSIDLIGGNDVLNAGANLQSVLTNTNNLINGGAGADILKLSAGTVLNLGALTANQTVKPISQMEIFQLQGNSVLTMTANDVLSLGGANTGSTSSGNTSTMSAYSFGSTIQTTNDGALTPTGLTSSTGKVQFVVNGTNTDVLVLDTLKLDGVTTNSIVGNTGLAGQWDYKGTVSITAVDGASHTYAVYDQSTTKAQVLVDLAVDVKLTTSTSPTNAGVGLAVSISTDANNDGLVNSTELSTATNFTSHITVNNTAVVGDVVVVTATNGETALTPVSKTLTTTDINNGFDVTFAKPGAGVKQVVTANYVSATGGPAADAAPTDSAEFIAAAPKVTVTMADKALTINETSLVTFQFSENVTGFTASDVSYSGGTLSALTKVSDSQWTATFTPTQNTNMVGNIISVAADSYTNTAGVNGSAGQDTYSVDTRLSSAVAGRGIGVSGSESFNNVTTAITFGVSFPVLSGAVIHFQRNGVDVHTLTVTNSDNINYRETSNFNGDWGATIEYQGQIVNLPRMERVSFNNNIAGFTQFTSPLVMDLNGDGVQTLNMTDGVMFDLQASGQKSAVGWVSRGDGLLVMDLNSDGQITSGAELFGNHKLLANGSKAQDGWQALSELDSNGDGQISAADADFAKLLVWVDANSDGVSDAGELQSLAEHGIVSINLGADQTRVAQNGNYLQGFSSYSRTDGTSHEIVDAWLEEASTNVAIVNQGVRDITGDVQANGQTSANVLKLNLTDVLAVEANANGQHQVIVHGDANDTVNLSNLLDTGSAQGSWQASGVVMQAGVTYNAYSNSTDASLQVLIDQHITQVHVG
jgi:hypothetical protein